MAKPSGALSWLRAAAGRRRTASGDGEFTQKDAEAVAKIGGYHDNAAGAAVNVQSAMTLSTVWACVRLIAESIASMPLHLLMADEDNPKKATRHPLYVLLAVAPNSKSTPVLFWESVVTAMLLQGNAYIHKRRDRQGRLVSLLFLSPDRLVVSEEHRYGPKTFKYTYDDGVQRDIPAKDVWQLQGYSMNGKDGVSVITYAREVFGTAIAAERSAARTFLNGMLQAVYYTVSAFLTDEQRDGFRKHVKGTVERGEAPILEGGVDVKSLGIKPQDAQLLQSRSFSVEEICRWFRVPPHMVGHSEKATSWGSGLETQTLAFLQFTLKPWIERIQQGIVLGLLEPHERAKYKPVFDTEDLLRMDSTALANFLGTIVNKGLATVNEGRRRLGLPPLKGGNADKLLVQGAMVLLDSLEETPPDDPGTPGEDPPDDLQRATARLQQSLKAIKGETNT